MTAAVQSQADLAPSLGRHVRASLLTGVLLSVALVAGAQVEIAGAVLAGGQVVVENEVKKVQHPTGGVVAQIFVKNGDRVGTGDLLLRLDDTQTRASLDIILRALDELAARRARNEAERDGAPSVDFAADLRGRRGGDAVTARLLDGEARLFASRVSAREGQRAQLRERVAQLTQEISGLSEQAQAKDSEIKLIATELGGVRDLYAKNLVPISRVTALERDSARLKGEAAQLRANAASARGKVAEVELQILQIDQDLRSEVGRELADIRSKWSELVERRVAAEDQLRRIDIRAPADGIVHQLGMHTVGGVLAPNEPAMLVVPAEDRLVVEARVQPQDIDGIHVGQVATLRFPAFNMRTTPEIEGILGHVSADVSVDPKTGASFYTARVGIRSGEEARLGGLRLLPGMPVEAHVRTGTGRS